MTTIFELAARLQAAHAAEEIAVDAGQGHADPAHRPADAGRRPAGGCRNQAHDRHRGAGGSRPHADPFRRRPGLGDRGPTQGTGGQSDRRSDRTRFGQQHATRIRKRHRRRPRRRGVLFLDRRGRREGCRSGPADRTPARHHHRRRHLEGPHRPHARFRRAAAPRTHVPRRDRGLVRGPECRGAVA